MESEYGAESTKTNCQEPKTKGIMERLDFDRRLLSLVMESVSSASDSVLLNGEPKGYLHPTRVA